MTSYSRFQTNALAKLVDTTCILFYTHSPHSLLYNVVCNKNRLSTLHVGRPEENAAFNAKTEQFIIGKISSNQCSL